MGGGTEFHFVTEGIHKALELAIAAAGALDLRLGGGVATIRQYLRALGYECVKHVAGERATHVFLRRRA